jgi:hypothetical protein
MSQPELRAHFDFLAIWPDDQGPFLNVLPAFPDGKIWHQNQTCLLDLKSVLNGEQ